MTSAMPRYKSRKHYRTRRSSSERIAICPSIDFGATALDRPIVGALVFRAPSAAPSDPAWAGGRLPLVRLGLSFVFACAVGGVGLGLLLALTLR